LSGWSKLKPTQLADTSIQFEQLKKEQNKKSKKGGAKKKDVAAEEAAGDVEETAEPAAPVEPSADHTETVNNDGEEDTQKPSDEKKPRSDSFKNPGAEVQELYRKQASRIEELEKENKALKQQGEDGKSRSSKLEEELESLREVSSEAVKLRSKAKEADRLTEELATTQRQVAQLQAAAKAPVRKASGTDSALAGELASKLTIIEQLELEISKLRNTTTELENKLSERDATILDHGERARETEAATAAAKRELDNLKVSIAFPSDETKAANEDPEALTKRITVLESDLRTAQGDLEAAASRASALERKIEALNNLLRDATTSSQAKDRELNDLRTQLKRNDKPSHVRDASDFELGDEETEAGALQARIRALEAENFELRRGVWRDQRAALQPGMHDDGDEHGYEDVDLNGPGQGGGGMGGFAAGQRHSTLQDVITSGISAFTGRPRDAARPGQTHERKLSLGLLSDDGFDEDAFRLAQEEDAKRRVERVKEVKRSLEQWRGWRMDIADLRRNGIGGNREVGPVFEV
jgi:chromosome segregation ATPase